MQYPIWINILDYILHYFPLFIVFCFLWEYIEHILIWLFIRDETEYEQNITLEKPSKEKFDELMTSLKKGFSFSKEEEEWMKNNLLLKCWCTQEKNTKKIIFKSPEIKCKIKKTYWFERDWDKLLEYPRPTRRIDALLGLIQCYRFENRPFNISKESVLFNWRHRFNAYKDENCMLKEQKHWMRYMSAHYQHEMIAMNRMVKTKNNRCKSKKEA